MQRKHWITVVALVAFVLSVIGIWRLLNPFYNEPPVVIGSELDSAGKPLREVVFEGSYRESRLSSFLDFSPCVSHPNRTRYDHYYLVAANGSRQELSFLADFLPPTIIISNLCMPIAGTARWVAAGYFEPGPQIEVYTFDPTGVLTHRTISISHDDALGAPDFWFVDGNRTLRYRTGSALGSYDVVTDTVAP
jgi:hypothetical protein